jgi:hypothetical protein
MPDFARELQDVSAAPRMADRRPLPSLDGSSRSRSNLSLFLAVTSISLGDFFMKHFSAGALIAVVCAFASTFAQAAPPSSCAGKFIGDWRHSGSGNRGILKRDGQALCTEHPACVQGTWTCSGNVLMYTNSMGTWNYTLAPDGKSMSANGGAAVAVRLGPVPASARSKDLGSAAKNVTSDILGFDRTPSADERPPSPAPTPSPQSAKRTPQTSSEGLALLNTGNDFFNTARRAGDNRNSYLRSAERFYSKAADEFRKAGDARNERIALSKAANAKRESEKPLPRAPVQASNGRNGGKGRIPKDSLRCRMYQKQLEANADDRLTAELIAKLKAERPDCFH